MAHPDIAIAGATFQAVPSIIVPKAGGGNAQFYDMDDDKSFLGTDVECIDDNAFSKTFCLADTDYGSWTASTTAQTILASETKNAAFQATDLADNGYYIVWECGLDPVYVGTPAETALPKLARSIIVQEILKRPYTLADIASGTWGRNACVSLMTQNFMRYFGTTVGTETFTWTTSYGFYFAATAATFSSNTSASPNVTIKTPTLVTRCSNTYFSTTNANMIDADESAGFIRAKVFRTSRSGFMRNIYRQVVNLVNS